MCQWGIEDASLVGHFLTCFIAAQFLDLPHEIHTIGNNDEDNAHILGKRQHEVTIVFGLDAVALGVQLVNFQQAVNDFQHIVTKQFANFSFGYQTVMYILMEHGTDDDSPTGTDFFDGNQGCLQVEQHRVETEFAFEFGLLLNLLAMF